MGEVFRMFSQVDVINIMLGYVLMTDYYTVLLGYVVV